MTYLFESEKLTAWFEENRRDLPWREDRTPYATWVSEIMLQQTTVAAVIPYFIRWMRRFPTLKALAEASQEEVIKEWEGLGYYSRARNLHAGAKQVYERFGEEVPRDPETLSSIKGLGPYTIGALCSFAFHQKMPAVDGNVIRVLSRYFNIADDVSKPSTINALRKIAAQILPEEKHWLFNEGLIELGATICQKKPRCAVCPLVNTCKSFRAGNQTSLPVKLKKQETIPLHRVVAIIRSGDHFLIKKVSEGVMSDLHEFPYFELSGNAQEQIERAFPLARFIHSLPTETHSFTKYRATLYPLLFEAERFEVHDYRWVSYDEMERIPFSSGHRRIKNKLEYTWN